MLWWVRLWRVYFIYLLCACDYGDSSMQVENTLRRIPGSREEWTHLGVCYLAVGKLLLVVVPNRTMLWLVLVKQ
jgi:hypothetical protein